MPLKEGEQLEVEGWAEALARMAADLVSEEPTRRNLVFFMMALKVDERGDAYWATRYSSPTNFSGSRRDLLREASRALAKIAEQQPA